MAVGRSSALERFIGADGSGSRLSGNPFPDSGSWFEEEKDLPAATGEAIDWATLISGEGALRANSVMALVDKIAAESEDSLARHDAAIA